MTTPAPEAAKQLDAESRAPAITCDRRVRTGLCKATFTLPALPLLPSIPDWPLDGPDSGSYAALKQAALAAGWTSADGEWLCPEHQGGTPWWPAGDSGRTGAAGSLPHPLGAGLTVPPPLPKRIPQPVSPEDLPGPDRPRSMGAQGELIRAGEPGITAGEPAPGVVLVPAVPPAAETGTGDREAGADLGSLDDRAAAALDRFNAAHDAEPPDEQDAIEASAGHGTEGGGSE